MSKKRNVIVDLIVGTILYQLCHASWLKKTRNDAAQNATEQRRTYHILPKNSGNRASILPLPTDASRPSRLKGSMQLPFFIATTNPYRIRPKHKRY